MLAASMGGTQVSYYNGLMCDVEGNAFYTPIFPAADDDAAWEYIQSEYPEYSPVDVLFAGGDNE